MKHFNDIEDNEIRIIGNASQSGETPRTPFWRRLWFWATIAALVVLCLLAAWGVLAHRSSEHYRDSVTECAQDTTEAVAPTVLRSEPATVLIRDTVINDVPLRLRTPVNAVPELVVGIPDINDESLILTHQAADIRADNREIVGAFVLRGELLSRGIAKKGFCAILDGTIQLGMAESTPLFEEAINNEGYFFRQYPLVSNGRMVENKPKGKALRHALCELDGRIVTVSSRDKESFHDFAQALADLGVQNAIYLTGADSYGFCRTDADGMPETTDWGVPQTGKAFENVNFIVWRVAE